MRFIGRKEELEVLERLRLKKSSSLAVVWGRRRRQEKEPFYNLWTIIPFVTSCFNDT